MPDRLVLLWHVFGLRHHIVGHYQVVRHIHRTGRDVTATHALCQCKREYIV